MFDVDAVPATLDGARTRSARLEARLRATRRASASSPATGRPGRYTSATTSAPWRTACASRTGVDLFILIADYQVLTDRDSRRRCPSDVEALLADYLAVGLDPARATSSPTPRSRR